MITGGAFPAKLRRMQFRSIGLLPFALMLGCADGEDQGATQNSQKVEQLLAARQPAHRTGFAEVDGARLHYLDWGGDGPAIVMIGGVGQNPHIFDDLAAQLSRTFRVVAYAPRGNGRSDAPSGPFDTDTRAQDLLALMNSLDIGTATLVGWSTAGAEITRFAGVHPERVHRLVYLDAAYDWSDAHFRAALQSVLRARAPKGTATASFSGYRKWYRKHWVGPIPWTEGLDEFLLDNVRVLNGGNIAPRPDDAALLAMLQAIDAPPDYKAVKASALALYASAFFPAVDHDDPAAAATKAFETAIMMPFREASSQALRSQLHDVEIETIAKRTHYGIGLKDPDKIASTIREFVSDEESVE